MTLFRNLHYELIFLVDLSIKFNLLERNTCFVHMPKKGSSELDERFKSYRADTRYPIFKVCCLDLDSMPLRVKQKEYKAFTLNINTKSQSQIRLNTMFHIKFQNLH